LTDLAELDSVPVRRNSSNHLENTFFDLILTDARSLVTRYRRSLLSRRYKDYSNYIEAFVHEAHDLQSRGLNASRDEEKENKETRSILTARLVA
jgi:hypothetical protein